MNNNRNNNNRRRGRGNNNRQQGGGQQLNRIDSRARGNAPQMLEKYRKLAHDAHLNGDRVQAEYYLQFADHYFRVIADQRLRQEEQRARRDERPGEASSYDEGDDGDFGNENDIPGFDQPYRREERNEPRRDDRDGGSRDGANREGGNRDGQREPRNREEGREDRGREDRGREERGQDRGRDRAPRRERFEQAQQPREEAPVEDAPAEAASAFEPTGGNPFTRDNRISRGGLRPRREREAPRAVEGEPGDEESVGLDPAMLPPAISESREAVAEVPTNEAPAPKRRGRPRKVVPTETGEGGESLETVSG